MINWLFSSHKGIMQFWQSFIEVLKEVLTNLTQYMQSKNNMTACEYSKSDNVKANSSCCLALQDSLQWSLYDSSSASFSAWLIFHLASLLDSINKNSTVAHNNRKTRTTQADISVKNPRITVWKLTLKWEHLFWTFLTWFWRKNDLGGLETRTKGKTEQTV